MAIFSGCSQPAFCWVTGAVIAIWRRERLAPSINPPADGTHGRAPPGGPMAMAPERPRMSHALRRRRAESATQLTYVVDELVDQKLIQLRGENKTVIAVDTLTFRPVASGTEVTYAAEFTFKGLSRIVAPLLKPPFERLGNEAEAGLRTALNRL
jgi:hypothetical protein